MNSISIISRRVPSRLAAAAVLALALAACARATPPEAQGLFPEAVAGDLFASGYRHVQDRYIEPVTAERLALGGLDGLNALAPGLRVRRADGHLELLSNDRLVREFALPASADSESWGRLTAAVLQAGWSASPQLRAAPPEQIYNSMFGGLLRSLDGYSRYTDSAAADQARASREGFGGLGLSVEVADGRTRIVSIQPNTPAFRAGLQERDEIVEIDRRPIAGLGQRDVVNRLRGTVDSEVALTIARGEPPVAFELVVARSHIVPQTVTYRRLGEIAYYRISSFNRHTTSDLLRLIGAAQQEMGQIGGIVLDLRGNPGGLLDQAVAIADLFLTDGLIVATRGRHPASNSSFAASGGDIARGVPLAVLINGRSASAAEMLAAALQDWGRAVLVGSTSHGKGSVQNVARLPNGGELIITWSRMHAPSGYVLDRLGVLPGVCTSDAAEASKTAQGPRLIEADFAAWHRYDTADEAVARTLRMACPAEPDEQDVDLEVARRMLGEPGLYRQALRPWIGAVMAERVSPAAQQASH